MKEAPGAGALTPEDPLPSGPRDTVALIEQPSGCALT
jgi:hypothetical protein